MERPRSQGEFARLFAHRTHDFVMAVPLIHCGIGGEEVEILLPVGIPYENALAALQHHGQRMVVVGAVTALPFDYTPAVS